MNITDVKRMICLVEKVYALGQSAAYFLISAAGPNQFLLLILLSQSVFKS